MLKSLGVPPQQFSATQQAFMGRGPSGDEQSTQIREAMEAMHMRIANE